MNIHIGKNGSQLGPFDEATVRSMLQSGSITLRNLYWIEGQTSWEPLSALFPDLAVPRVVISTSIQPPPATPLTSSSAGILLARNGSQIGPFDEATVRTMLQSGMASIGDLYWVEGKTSWEPLGSLFPDHEVSHPIQPIRSTTIPQILQPETPVPKSAKSVIIAGYICAFVALLLFPPAFALAGMTLGIIAITRGNTGHGVTILAASLITGIYGFILGAMSVL